MAQKLSAAKQFLYHEKSSTELDVLTAVIKDYCEGSAVLQLFTNVILYGYQVSTTEAKKMLELHKPLPVDYTPFHK